MNLRDWYFAQIVTQSQMDEAFGWAEDADHEIVVDHELTGIAYNIGVSPTGPASMAVVVSAPGAIYDKTGARVYISETNPLVDCSIDEYGSPTAVTTAGNERWLSIFARAKRNETDPEIDGNGLNVNTRRWESYEIYVRRADEYLIGTNTKPPLDSEAVLICDVRLEHLQTTITMGDISTDRSEWWSDVSTTNFGRKTSWSAKRSVSELWSELDTVATTGGAYTPGQTWFGSVTLAGPTPPVTSAVEGLDAIIYDLKQTTGSARIGTANSVHVYCSWTGQSVNGALQAAAAAISNHVGGAAPYHPATAITYSGYGWLPAGSHVDNAFKNVVEHLGSQVISGLQLDGVSRIGVEEIPAADGLTTIGNSTLRDAMVDLAGVANAATRREHDDDITGDWTFGNVVTIANPELSGLDKFSDNYGGRQNNFGYINSSPAHPGTSAFVWGGSSDRLCDIVPYSKAFSYSERRQPMGVGIKSTGDLAYYFLPGNLESPVDSSRAISGLAPGVTEISAACGDGRYAYVLVRRAGAGNDSVACLNLNASPISVVWESSLATPTALAGYPKDRIILGRRISSTVWQLLILNGNIACNVDGVIQSKRSDTGASYGFGDKNGGAAYAAYNPTGGLAYGRNMVVFTMDDMATHTPRLARLDANSGTSYSASLLGSGGVASDIAYDVRYDGAAFWWISKNGNLRYWRPEASNIFSDELYNGSALGISGYGFSLAFDGRQLWVPGIDDSTLIYNLYSYAPGRFSTGDPGANGYRKIFNDAGTSWTPFSTWGIGRLAVIGPFLMMPLESAGVNGSLNRIVVLSNSAYNW